MRTFFFSDEVEQLARELHMRLYRTSVKDDVNVCGVFQHLAENYVDGIRGLGIDGPALDELGLRLPVMQVRYEPAYVRKDGEGAADS